MHARADTDREQHGYRHLDTVSRIDASLTLPDPNAIGIWLWQVHEPNTELSRLTIAARQPMRSTSARPSANPASLARRFLSPRSSRKSNATSSQSFNRPVSRNKHHHKVRESFETSLKALGLDYVDLYLIHWPQSDTEEGVSYRIAHDLPLTPRTSGEHIPCGQYPTVVDTWKQMEQLLDTGTRRPPYRLVH